MKISGKEIGAEIYDEVYKKYTILRKNKIVPHLMIIKSCDSSAIDNYIGQKITKAKKIGVQVEVLELTNADFKDLNLVYKKISDINTSPKLHGIIFQKPSNTLVNDNMEKLIDPKKDVDGFLQNTFYKPPVYRGVIRVLEKIYSKKSAILISYLSTKKITLLGKGKTGGQTIITGLQKDGFKMSHLQVIDSKTSIGEIHTLISKAHIIISAVGKKNPVDYTLFPKKAILIDIGVHFDKQNKIKGDFDEADIKDRVDFYTTTPGGIGATTVAYLMDNVINSAIMGVKSKHPYFMKKF